MRDLDGKLRVRDGGGDPWEKVELRGGDGEEVLMDMLDFEREFTLEEGEDAPPK